MQGCEPRDLADAGRERFPPAVSAYPVAPNLVRGVQALRAADAFPAHGDATVSPVDPASHPVPPTEPGRRRVVKLRVVPMDHMPCSRSSLTAPPVSAPTRQQSPT